MDDNPVNLMVISALLESRGLMPFLAADGAEAVALASGHHFDLILMDLQMPILDGLEATSASGASRANVRGSRSLSSPTPARRLAPRSWRRAA